MQYCINSQYCTDIQYGSKNPHPPPADSRKKLPKFQENTSQNSKRIPPKISGSDKNLVGKNNYLLQLTCNCAYKLYNV